MIDPKVVEENPKLLKETIKARGMPELIREVDHYVKLRKEWVSSKMRIDELRHKRNVISQAINKSVKSGNKKAIAEKRKEAKKISDGVARAQNKIARLGKQLEEVGLEFPNILTEPSKKDKVILQQGKPKREKWMKTYEKLSKQLDILDIDVATEISGAGFYVLKGPAAKLERALISFFLDTHAKAGYKEHLAPLLVTERSMINSGQLPKFKEDMFLTQEKLYLIPTSEVSLLNLHANKMLNESDLPIHITAFSPCFRIERGATKGFQRVKQFSKVELFKFTKPEESFKELEKMLKDVCAIVKPLKLPFRVRILPADEVGIASTKTYDIEVFAPGSNEWLEISSVSNCTDFQARRARIRYVTPKGERKLVHTLNGSGIALPRTIIAILENYQQKDGSIKIPTCLQKYMGTKKIGKK